MINSNPNSVTVRAEGSSVFAYVTSSEGGFHIFDVTDPANIYQTNYYYNGGDYRDAYIQGNYAYAVLFDSKVQIIDITNNNCVPVNNFFVSGETAWGITVENNLAYVNVSTNLDRYLNVFDIDDPLNPIDLGTYRTSGNVQTTSFTNNGRCMYISDYYDFAIYRPLFNYKPLPFSLLTPEDSTIFITGNDIDFGWENSEDANDDTLLYTVNIWNSVWDTNIFIEDTTLILNVNYLPDSGNYLWTVMASDGMYQQNAIDTFSFNYFIDVGIGDLSYQTPQKNEILQNFPNPFNQKTTINFSIVNTSHVMIDVYNLQGQKICNLLDNVITPGYNEIVWNGKKDSGEYATGGIYFIRMKGSSEDGNKNNFTNTKKILIVR